MRIYQFKIMNVALIMTKGHYNAWVKMNFT